jgi:predicted peroxiredoxin
MPIYCFGKSLWISVLLLATASATGASERLLTILATDNQETQMMALVLTTQAHNQGAEVNILLCGEAGYLATEIQESKTFAPAGRSPRDLLRNLQANGVNVAVCAIFLPQRELDETALWDGVTVARPPEVAALMMQKDVKLLTF